MIAPYPVFTYWDGDESLLQSFSADWAEAGHQLRIFDLDDVRWLIASSQGAARLALFDRIRISACRSDLARLMLLFAYGGLYVDAHTGSGNQTSLATLFAWLVRKELVLIDNVLEHTSERTICVQNGAMLARAGCNILSMMIDTSFKNLEWHEAREKETPDYVEYNIFAMTGGWSIFALLFDLDKPHRLKEGIAPQVHLESLDMRKPGLPFYWYRHYHYRQPRRHWSERQQVERLFESR